MDEAWERAVAAAGGGQADPRALTLDGAVKCLNGRLPSRALLERFRNLEHLSIANVRMASLENFPRLPRLRRLILSDNRISGGLDSLVAAGLDALRDLDISNNRIQSLEDLAPLAQLRLVSLDLYECPVTKSEDYRSRVFGMIRSLKYLDKMDADENERLETDDEDDEDDNEEEEDEEGEEDLGSGEVDGDDRIRNMANGAAVVDIDEDEESDAGGEMETSRRSAANGSSRGSRQHLSNGLREGEDEDEEEEEDGDLGEEIDEEEEDEDDEEVGEEGGEEGGDEEVDEPGSTGRMTITEGEIDGHERGEDEDDKGEGEEEVEDVGALYLVPPFAQLKDEEGGSALDACNEEDGSEEVEDDEDRRRNGVPPLPSSSQPSKRKKDGGDNLNDGNVDGSRPSKQR